MKKIALIGLISLLSACASQKADKPNLNEEYLLGNWECLTIYKDINSYTVDKMNLAKDKTFKDNGIITMYKAFKYKTDDEGTWSLDNDRLTYQFNGARKKVERYFPNKEAEKALKTNPKFAELKKFEEKIFAMLKADRSSDSIKLIITEIFDWKFHYKQDLGSDHSAEGICMRPGKKK